MPTYTRGDATIHYEVHGEGFPVLALAPGGMRSAIDFWPRMVWDPMARLAGDFQVVVMDQRNAGRSTAPVRASDGWADYCADQLGLMDHLGHERFHVVGMCIGGSFIMEIAKTAPERMAAAVALQPIGYDGDRQLFLDMFNSWAEDVKPDHPEARDADFEAFNQNLFGSGEFTFNVGEDFAARCQTPILVMMGNDAHHPQATSRRMAELAPNARLIENWKEPEHIEAAAAEIEAFLKAHS